MVYSLKPWQQQSNSTGIFDGLLCEAVPLCELNKLRGSLLRIQESTPGCSLDAPNTLDHLAPFFCHSITVSALSTAMLTNIVPI